MSGKKTFIERTGKEGLMKIRAGVLLCLFTVMITGDPAFGLSVALDARGEQGHIGYSVENFSDKGAYEETLRLEYRYVSVRVGGTNMTVALLDGHNRILAVNNYKWKSLFRQWPKKREKKTDANANDVVGEIVTAITKIIEESGHPLINHISVNVAGPIDKDFGLVGTDFPSPSLPFNDYPIIKKLSDGLKKKNINARFELSNDTESAVIGETITPRGLLHTYENGCAVIIGTGVNIGVKKNGRYYMGDQGEIREAGHKIIQTRADDGTVHFMWVGDKAGTFHPIEKGRPDEKIIQKSGTIGMKYVSSRDEDPEKFRQKYPQFPIVDYEAGLRDLEDVISGEHINRRLARANAPYTVATLTDAALRGDEELKQRARDEIRAIARDIGKGLAAFIDAYRNEAFVEHIILCSSVAENLGRGVYDRAGDEEDIFMATLRGSLIEELTDHFKMPESPAQEIAAGVLRSEMDVQRELIAYDPGITEMEDFKARYRAPAGTAVRVANEREQVEDMLARIDREIKEVGAGNLPKKVIMSDFHGQLDRFFAYIADAINRDLGRAKAITLDHGRFLNGISIKQQLAEQGIYDLKRRLNFEFYLLGDFADRGDHGLHCFLAALELEELGVAQIVLGNHDILWFLAAQGYHLPIYDGYNIYPEYGHERSAELLKRYKDEFARDEDRLREWSKRSHEYRKEQGKLQERTFTIDGRQIAINDILTETRAIYETVKQDLSKEERMLFGDLIGKNVAGTDIWTGFRACGYMSDQWWAERLRQTGTARAKYSPSEDLYRVWDTMYTYTEKTSELFNVQLARMNEKYWWWQVFNDIHHMNYTSPEWYALDWLYHKEWGPNLLKELNALEKDPAVSWNQTNFMEHPLVKKFIEFCARKFSLTIRDEYWSRYTHGWFPFDEMTGRIEMTYKGINYKNDKIWDLLELLKSDIRTARSLTEVQEALRLIMSWYADNTVKIKSIHIRRAIEKFGLHAIFQPLVTRILFNGHNPQNELLKQNIGLMVFEPFFAAVFTDKGMSEKYKDLGCYVEVSGRGIKAYGFSNAEKNKIVENPHTMTIGKDNEIMASLANASLDRLDFLKTVRKQLRGVRKQLIEAEQRPNAVLAAA